MDSLRVRDYTFSASLPRNTFGISGQGADFYRFIKSKVIMQIDSKYRTDKADRTIMGIVLEGILGSLVCYAIQHIQ